MGPFLADPMPSPRRFVWFGVGLAIAFASSLLVPEPVLHTSRSPLRVVGWCAEGVQAPAPVHITIGPMSIAPGRLPHRGHEAAMARTAADKLVELSRAKPWTVRHVREDHTERSGVHVDATLETLETKTELDPNLDGDVQAVVVTCNVRLRVAAYPERTVVASVAAGARVTAAAYTGPNELVVSQQACITAALEDAAENAFPAIDRAASRAARR
jgi:hypothetical protein